MNYGELERLSHEEENDGQRFYQEMFNTVNKCKYAVKRYLSTKSERPIEAKIWREAYHEHAVTLKCFFNCRQTPEKESLQERFISATGFEGDVIDHNGNYDISYVEWLEEQIK